MCEAEWSVVLGVRVVMPSLASSSKKFRQVLLTLLGDSTRPWWLSSALKSSSFPSLQRPWLSDQIVSTHNILVVISFTDVCLTRLPPAPTTRKTSRSGCWDLVEIWGTRIVVVVYVWKGPKHLHLPSLSLSLPVALVSGLLPQKTAPSSLLLPTLLWRVILESSLSSSLGRMALFSSLSFLLIYLRLGSFALGFPLVLIRIPHALREDWLLETGSK